MTTVINTGNPLLDFRLAYLRALAKSWSDAKFRQELLNATDIQDILIQQFSLSSKWPNVDFSLIRNDQNLAHWAPVETAGWVGPNDVFRIALPQKPTFGATEALAAFYQLYPDCLGAAVNVQPPGSSQTGGAPTRVMGPIPTSLGIGGNGDSLTDFGGLVLRAVALAWESDQFRSELLTASATDATPILSQWLGYNSPFNFFIQFFDAAGFVWTASSTGAYWAQISPDGKPIKNKVELNYPNPPESEPLRPIALTSYNNTGPAYPFTCC